MEHVIYDGVDLSARYITLAGDRPIASVDTTSNKVNGRDDYQFMGADLDPEPVEFYVMVFDRGIEGKRDAVRELAPILLVTHPVMLQFSSDNGLYYVGLPVGKPDFKEFVRSGQLKVKFQPLHAAMYGVERSVIVPSGGMVEFVVNGSYPTMPRIEAQSARRDGASNAWGLRLDDGRFLYVETGSDDEFSLEADCEARTLTVNGSAALPTLESDWLQLPPGSHTISNDQGTGQCTVTWVERWL